MKGVVVTKISASRRSGRLKRVLVNFIFLPIRSGLWGFSAFFTILLISKYLGYSLGTLKTFNVDIQDIYLSMLGFVLVFLIKVLENFNDREES